MAGWTHDGSIEMTEICKCIKMYVPHSEKALENDIIIKLMSLLLIGYVCEYET